MAKVGRPGLSDDEKSQLWRMWGTGSSITEISEAISRAPGSIFTVLCSNGGYVPRTPTRRPDSLTLEEREEISRGLVADLSFKAIAETLGRATSTVSREVSRNGGRKPYRAAAADEAAWERAKRPQSCLLAASLRWPTMSGSVWKSSGHRNRSPGISPWTRSMRRSPSAMSRSTRRCSPAPGRYSSQH
jgi:hypothetical protein